MQSQRNKPDWKSVIKALDEPAKAYARWQKNNFPPQPKIPDHRRKRYQPKAPVSFARGIDSRGFRRGCPFKPVPELDALWARAYK